MSREVLKKKRNEIYEEKVCKITKWIEIDSLKMTDKNCIKAYKYFIEQIHGEDVANFWYYLLRAQTSANDCVKQKNYVNKLREMLGDRLKRSNIAKECNINELENNDYSLDKIKSIFQSLDEKFRNHGSFGELENEIHRFYEIHKQKNTGKFF